MPSQKSSFTDPLMYKGMPILLRDDIPTGEIWFVNEDNFIIARVKDTELISWFKALRIILATNLSEIPIIGRFLSRLIIKPSPIDWLNHTNDKDTKTKV